VQHTFRVFFLIISGHSKEYFLIFTKNKAFVCSFLQRGSGSFWYTFDFGSSPSENTQDLHPYKALSKIM
jgi:hypothetical protein